MWHCKRQVPNPTFLAVVALAGCLGPIKCWIKCLLIFVGSSFTGTGTSLVAVPPPPPSILGPTFPPLQLSGVRHRFAVKLLMPMIGAVVAGVLLVFGQALSAWFAIVFAFVGVLAFLHGKVGLRDVTLLRANSRRWWVCVSVCLCVCVCVGGGGSVLVWVCIGGCMCGNASMV
jgi:hypothetical protein